MTGVQTCALPICITTPFDMRVLNEVDRYHLVMLALNHLSNFEEKSSYLLEYCKNMLVKHSDYIKEHGVDMPEVSSWSWENFIKKTNHDLNVS